ncbi:MAG: CocE/NonD family hydrolase [Acidobacteriaceae bacterium]|nr:CocE/NonD family hydrolase [Acidobacteriaceae bacterium]
MKSEYRIPMRDGKRLFTIVYAPRDTSKDYPILLSRTPYSVAPYEPDVYPESLGPSRRFDQDGFIYAFQDVRGRYQSEGEWEEMRPILSSHTGTETDESTDTYDTIEWLLKNVHHNNGKAGLIGISYPGFYATAGLIEAHPALVAVSPQAPIADLYMGDDAYHNGAFCLLANYAFYRQFPPQRTPTFGSDRPRDEPASVTYKRLLKTALLNLLTSNPYWVAAARHSTYDEFWQARNILPHLRDVRPAVLVAGGWFDAEDLAGTLKTYAAIRSQSPQTTVHLAMGPWAHGDWEGGAGNKLGDLQFGSETSTFFQNEIALPFFRRYLKSAPDPHLPAAYVFETGENQWHRSESWPPATSPLRLYLSANHMLQRSPPADPSGCDEYKSDPDKPVPYFHKARKDVEATYMDADQRFVSSRRDVLRYMTEPLPEDIVTAGPISPSLFISSSGSDSDFIVKLIDVYPHDAGRLPDYQQLVRGEPFRAKFRNSFEQPEPLEPGRITRIHFSMPDVFHRFLKGHRIMIEIQSSWFPLIDRNPQCFTDIPRAQPSEFRTALERIYRSKDASSYVELPAAPKQ